MNKVIDDKTLKIISESIQDGKNITILSCYEQDGNIYGIFINSLHDYISFVKKPEFSITTQVDDYNIIFIELGAILYYIYNLGSSSFYNLLVNAKSDNEMFNNIIDFVVDNPPIEKFVGQLKNMIYELGTLEPNWQIIQNTIVEIESFDKIYHILDEKINIIDDDDNSLIKFKVYIDNVASKLDVITSNKISEKKITELDNMFTQLCIKCDI